MSKKFDFSGWATKNDLRCSDGRVIRTDAFKDNDGETVPLVWNHQHNDNFNVLGHALLENRAEGVYAYCSFNDSEAGQNAKMLVEHGDVNALSIYANQLKQHGKDVIHGAIREVSLVLAGANPGAFIDNVVLAHSGLETEEEAIIYTGEEFDFYHSALNKDEEDEEDEDIDDEDIEDEEDSEDSEEDDEDDEEEKDEKMVEKKRGCIKHSDLEENDKTAGGKTVKDVLDTMNDEQKLVVSALVAKALEEAKGSNEENEDSEGGKEMKHNVFENEANDTLMHDGLNTIMAEGKRYGSLKESYLAHAAEYGIENIEFLNPEDHDIYDRPQFINIQPSGWVQEVIGKVHNTPFAKVRMMFADITEDEARAKGYIKGKYKKEEVFKLLKRSVAPTTIYKKQKFDRDDLLDADFDVVPWIKEEMNLKLDEEKARAYLFGDGRSAADEDKVDEGCIIPVVSDEDLYTIKVTVTPGQDESVEHAIITSAVLAQDDYQGSGNTTAFIEAKQVSRMLLMEDKFGHRLYKDVTELAGAMGVSKVTKVPAGVIPANMYGVIVDLSDYNVGMKNAGQKNFFDDFDIDYNQNKYLLETRQSGALTRPYSAIVLKKNV